MISVVPKESIVNATGGPFAVQDIMEFGPPDEE